MAPAISTRTIPFARRLPPAAREPAVGMNERGRTVACTADTAFGGLATAAGGGASAAAGTGDDDSPYEPDGVTAADPRSELLPEAALEKPDGSEDAEEPPTT